MITPAAAAHVPLENSAPVQGEPVAADEPVTTVSAGSSQASAGSSQTNATNYTHLYLDDQYQYGEVKPGNSTTFNITVANGEDHAVELSPHVVLPQLEAHPIQDAWITIEDANTTLGANAERTFTVTVSVPEDTELGDYQAAIALTEETISYPARPPQPIHAATISVEVYQEPTVTIQSPSYYSTSIQAGSDYTYEVVVENTGENAVPLNPSIETEESRYRDQATAQRSWFDIEAPSEVAAGENATVEITVNAPSDASVGDYDAMVDLGLKDPGRQDQSDYWQQVDLGFQIWEQPEDPFVTDFQVGDEVENVTLTLSASQYREMANDRPASFDVTFVAPNGTVADHQRAQVTNRGSVSLTSAASRGETQGPYTSGNEAKQFVYGVDDPSAGEWTVQIMPHNTTDFSYEIVRNES
ncbi:conserved hypothetical protein containing N-terminal carbohydrate-binding module, putative alpha galactosidase [Halorhabdus tiamatea SARL4B]|uniref:Uncharacterized protein n=1 Tax=Halorhabdus tiamatea SARL4B TaxID=1033806 RepID=S6D8V8_9EURY|nr:conserved hypothetical protein containing N-terminal carbohydrate-binding module, putative alpha galactosidase [Halorhabdus tiamatea SARL4B]